MVFQDVSNMRGAQSSACASPSGLKEARLHGYVAGWQAGWIAGTKAIQNETCSPTTPPQSPSQSAIRIELSDEWRNVLHRNRKRQRRTRRFETTQRHNTTDVDLGGVTDRARRARATKLYGEMQTNGVIETEARLAAAFAHEVTRSGAQMWPIVALRAGGGGVAGEEAG